MEYLFQTVGLAQAFYSDTTYDKYSISDSIIHSFIILIQLIL